ncbi:MotE family protein [Pseudosulfitobacter sp. SM2401]|uniref:MotE family protein n=1 Tax=Pseudosulfitobacter sp. SM2401 TaxID=3350098 RepID=UPI0036F2E145
MIVKKSRTKNRTGPLFLIVGLLIGSAVLRIGLGTSAAMAKSEEAPQSSEPAMLEKPIQVETETVEISALVNAIQKREERVAEIELKQRMRGKALDVVQHEIERRIEALKLAEERLSATLARADTAAEDDVARLTTVYENMKPKDSAALFEEMEPKFAAGFLGRMRPDSAAAILSGLKPETAYTISVILAGRNANAPKS